MVRQAMVKAEPKVEPEFFKSLTVESVRRYIEPKATAAEVDLFLIQARMWELNPFKRELYLIKYTENDKAQIVMGYEVFLKRAERTNKLKGWRVWTEGKPKTEDFKAIIEIYRADWDKPFIHEVYWPEYYGRRKDGTITKMWAEKPRTMLKKVVISQGFRMVFPDELGGLPYVGEEISSIDPEDIPKQVIEPAPAAKPEVVTPAPAAVEKIVTEVAAKLDPQQAMRQRAIDTIKGMIKANDKMIVSEQHFKEFLLHFQNEKAKSVKFVAANSFGHLSFNEGKTEDLVRLPQHFDYMLKQYDFYKATHPASKKNELKKDEMHPGLVPEVVTIPDAEEGDIEEQEVSEEPDEDEMA